MKINMVALQAVEAGGGVVVDAILEAVQSAVLTAYRNTGGKQDARIDIDRGTGEVKIMAQELDTGGRVLSEWDDTPQGIAWIAATTAFRVIRQTPLGPKVKDELAERVYKIVRED